MVEVRLLMVTRIMMGKIILMAKLRKNFVTIEQMVMNFLRVLSLLMVENSLMVMMNLKT